MSEFAPMKDDDMKEWYYSSAKHILTVTHNYPTNTDVLMYMMIQRGDNPSGLLELLKKIKEENDRD